MFHDGGNLKNKKTENRASAFRLQVIPLGSNVGLFSPMSPTECRSRPQDGAGFHDGGNLKNKNGKPCFGFPSPGDPAGARTQDPNIKSVVLYLLSYEISGTKSSDESVLVVQM